MQRLRGKRRRCTGTFSAKERGKEAWAGRMNYANIKKYDVANGVGVRVSLFVSGCYNLFFYLRTQKPGSLKRAAADIFNRRTVRPGIYMVAFSAALITAKTLALRVAPNPGYVTALLLVAPIFVYVLNRTGKVPDNVSVKAGFSMIFFLLLLILLVNGNYGITD